MVHQINSKLLHRFWFVLEHSKLQTTKKRYVGITAFNEEDALFFLNTVAIPALGSAVGECKILSIVRDVDVSQLDPKHVLPNLGDVTIRGIWYPNFRPGRREI